MGYIEGELEDWVCVPAVTFSLILAVRLTGEVTATRNGIPEVP